MKSNNLELQPKPERGRAPMRIDVATQATHINVEGRCRAVIEAVEPSVDQGAFSAKRVTGETVRIEADIFSDGHDLLSAVVEHRPCGGAWKEVPLSPMVNDRWSAEYTVDSEGPHEFKILAWVDHFRTWRSDLRKRADAGQDLSVEFQIGAAMVEEAASSAPSSSRAELAAFAGRIRAQSGADVRLSASLDERLAALMFAHAPRRHSVESAAPFTIWVDRPRARFSAWYELFPRSTGHGGKHGTLLDVIEQLDRVRSMGFDVLYLPPIHPIGRAFLKGKNNSLTSTPDDVGSPWAIGGAAGGHDAIHPQLGTLADFKKLVAEAHARGIEIALDLALQCSPDHPWVKQHPGWFRTRPDGTIQYAENPPKKYQDIYPFDFECDDWKNLWNEILAVVIGWVEKGVKIFRVDNPHTKPFRLWQWLIAEVKRQHPDVLFLAEAFTRPKVMRRLAKLGFTQSYTYFAWRNDPAGIREYLTELTQTSAVDFFRPNAWPNTPDILTEYLQHGGRAAFVARAVLASTLCASWGVYGPAFELMEHVPAKPGSEEYLDSEKYQLRSWDYERPDSLAPLLATLNKARREHPALQQDRTLRFHPCDNPAIVAYTKRAGDDIILAVVNTDPHNTQWGTVDLDVRSLGLPEDRTYALRDLLTGANYTWQGWRNVVGFDPATTPAHLFHITG